jgi:hypothetical protein
LPAHTHPNGTIVQDLTLHIKENKIMNMYQIQQLIGSRVLCGIALLVGLALAATPALRTVAAAPMEPRTWQVGVGIETEDHRMQGNGFLPNQVWINTVRDGSVWMVSQLMWRNSPCPFTAFTCVAPGACPSCKSH